MDYAAVLRSLAKETGVQIPKGALQSRTRKPSESNGRPSSSRFDPQKLIDSFGTWNSGNDELNAFIQDTQRNARTPLDYLEWIPFDCFREIRFVAKGGFGSVFSAKTDVWGKVALKFLDNSETLSQEFLDELKAHHRCSLGSGIIDCYGVSKDPESNKYVMVMRYAEYGSLRRYLSQYFNELSWDERIRLFDRITRGLQGIHDEDLVHRDFHSGNILRHEKLVYVTDLGMCRPVDEASESKRTFGVVPYVAPEVLRGEAYTQAADIYALGMIMWELSSNSPPFADRAHDYKLAEDICNGLRPPIIAGTPTGYVSAMLRCWDADPHKRPTAAELLSASYRWRYLSNGKEPFTGPKSTRVRTGDAPKSAIPSPAAVHPQAFYTSRLLHFPNLPVPKNCDILTLFDPTTGELRSLLRKQSKKEPRTPKLFDESEATQASRGRQRESLPPLRRSELTRSMSTLNRADKQLIDKLRAERRKSTILYQWSTSAIDEVPKEVEQLGSEGKEKHQ